MIFEVLAKIAATFAITMWAATGLSAAMDSWRDGDYAGVAFFYGLLPIWLVLVVLVWARL